MNQAIDPDAYVAPPPPPAGWNGTKLNLRSLLIGDPNRLRHVYRYGTYFVHHRESVAEHSYLVGLYGYYLSQWVRANTPVVVNVERVLVRALFHDVDESRTGDFVRTFKYSSTTLKTAIDAASEREFVEAVSQVMPDLGLVLGLTEAWQDAKDGSTEGCIVALSDFLAVLAYVWQELATGNATIFELREGMLRYSRLFNEEQFDFLRPVISDAQALTQQVLGSPYHLARYQELTGGTNSEQE